MQATINPPTATVLDTAELSLYIGRSQASIARDDAAGRLPRALRIGRSKKWLRADIDLWLALGCPSRPEFEARKKSGC